jgi:electron-transferring-flavoprotein dehydrogenase
VSKKSGQVNEDYAGKVWHTLGYPLLDGTFGGGFVYGMKDKKLTIGMVISLDSKDPNMNPQQKLQDYKKHPFIQEMIQRRQTAQIRCCSPTRRRLLQLA